MSTQIAIKRLTASDLTLFKPDPANITGSQRAIELGSTPFVASFYPSLEEIVRSTLQISITLFLYGPQSASTYALKGKIVKDDTLYSWGLKGDHDFNLNENPSRYRLLEVGDIAVLEFSGVPVPSSVRMILLAAKALEDANLCSELSKFLDNLRPDETLLELSKSELEAAIQAADLTSPHVINVLRVDEDLEQAALGIQESIIKLQNVLPFGTVLPENLQQARDSAMQKEHAGERIVSHYLHRCKNEGEIQDFEWVSRVDANSHYRFRLIENDGTVVHVSTKSTTGVFDRPFHISLNELHQMNSDHGRYDIYRVYGMNENEAHIAIAQDMREFAQRIFDVFANLPDDVSADPISVQPSKISVSWQHQEYSPQ